MTKITLEELVESDVRLVSLPEVSYRIREAVDNPTTSFDTIANLVEQDTALTARVLRIANSGFFGFPYQIQSVSRAISIIGTQQLCDLVLATTVLRQFEGVNVSAVTMESFWKHSIGCAVIARILAAMRRETNIERFYVGGLLHDIGRLVIFIKMPELAQRIIDERDTSKRLLSDIERELLGFDHTEIGAALIRSWHLPAFYEESVRYHHRLSGATIYPIEAAVVHLADIIANALCTGTSGEYFVTPLDAEAYTMIDISESQLESVVTRIDQQYRCAISGFLG